MIKNWKRLTRPTKRWDLWHVFYTYRLYWCIIIKLRKEWKEETLKVQVGGKEWEVRIERSMYCEMTRDGKRKFAYDRDMIVLNDVSHACGISRRALTVSNRLKRNDMEPILHSLKSGYRNTELFCITLEQFKELCVIEPDYQVVFDQIYPRGLTSEKPSKNSERNWVKSHQ